MRQILAVAGGLALGVLIMLAVTDPRKKARSVERAGSSEPSFAIRSRWQFSEVETHLTRGELDLARTKLKLIMDTDPRSPRAYAYLAYVDIRAGELHAAQGHLARAAALDPDLDELPGFQGHLQMAKKNYGAAARSYTEALKRRPNYWYNACRAAARFELTEYAGAVEDATIALASTEFCDDARFTRASAYAALGQWKESLQDWTVYVAHHSWDARAWRNRGNVHYRMGQN